MPNLEIHYAEEWAALYVDGQLDHGSVGDSHIAEERAFNLLGVTLVQDDAFMRGQSQASGVAPTLDDVTAYAEERENRRATAARLREEAAAMLARASDLEAGR